MNSWHRKAWLGLISLGLLQIAWYGFWFPPVAISRAAAISLALLPFSLFLIAARKNMQRGLLIASLVALGYFSHGVMEAFANPSVRLLAMLEIIICVWVVACAGWPSWQGRRRKRPQ